ncbi:MAG: ATP-binding protein, partial [Muribaculaceae bacterium]|nr:ATP-binding protein [Muribaculaceae bacterium]
RYKRTIEEELQELKRNYDGYHFSEESPDIYNPFSLLQVFAKTKYSNYWISSGNATLLAEQLKKTNANVESLIHQRCSQTDLEGLDIERIHPTALLYQTGYLTIKKYDAKRNIFHLGLPNLEVKQGFFEFLLPWYASMDNQSVRPFVFDIIDEMEEGRVDDFMKRIQAMFAGFGHDLRFEEERNVQNAILVLFSLVGMQVDAEVRTSDGRIDILVKTSKHMYVMELKYDGSAKEALDQIERKEYYLPWSSDSRTIIEIGINYSTEKRRIDSWEVLRRNGLKT